MTRIITSNDTERFSEKEIGGKAKNLFVLKDAGMNVPPFLVIPFLEEKENTEEEQKTWLIEIKQFFSDLSEDSSFAVRSSALDEDGGKFSFAGQFETKLHVHQYELPDAILEVKKSANSERVRNYRKENNLPLHQKIAVIVQQMIPADTAGVAFGIDPISGKTDTKVISAVFGLGEGLVSGELDADTYTITPKEITHNIASKTHSLYYSLLEKTIIKEELDPLKSEVSVLSDEQIKLISSVLDKLNNLCSSPQDIEFAFYKSELFLLQTRPVTAVGKTRNGEFTVWDNSNIIESYPGITTPLTFSFIIKMYEKVYRQFVNLLGVKESEIDKHAHVFANTLGLVRGRVYYNLLSWYKMLAMVPGYSINAGFMENMMGVKERFELKEEYRMNKGLALFRILGMIFKMIWLQMRLSGERRRFMNHLNAVMAEYNAIDFSKLSAKEIIEKYKNFENTLLLKWKAPLINDFFAMIWFGILHKQAAKYFPEQANIHNDLLCGNRDIISIEPIHRSIEIAQRIRNNPEACQIFERNTPEECWNRLQEEQFSEIKKLIESYLHDFGERCIGELKLETISYSQDPIRFIHIIQSYVQQNVSIKNGNEDVDMKLRMDAERKVNDTFKGKWLKRALFNFVLKRARDLVSNRENLRYERTRGFGMVRKMFVALGENWAESGQLENPRDIFYLELSEIKDSQGMVTDEMRSQIKVRKAEFVAYQNQREPEERFYSYGNDFSDEFIYSKEKILPLEGNLKGIGCCPGRIKGKVKVVKDPQEISSLNGDILVTSNTDPGWVTLFPTASAIIVERGSLLSHSAIVSREMGIPCIVSVSGLLRTLKTGDLIEMDGSTGEIKILEDDKTVG